MIPLVSRLDLASALRGIARSTVAALPASRLAVAPSAFVAIRPYATNSLKTLREESSTAETTSAKARKPRTPSSATGTKKSDPEQKRLAKEKDLQAKAQAKEKAQQKKAKEQEKKAELKVKEQAKKAELKVKEQAKKEKERLKAKELKEKAKLKPYDALDAEGNKLPLPTANKPKLSSAFISFVRDKVPELRAQSQHQKQDGKTDIIKMTTAIGTMWKNLPEAEKEVYEAKFRKDQEVYRKKLAEWEANLTEQDRQRLQAYRRYMAVKGKQVKTGVTRSRSPDRPVMPMSGFFTFLQEYRRDHDVPSMRESAKAAGQAWNQMSAEQRAPYEEGRLEKMEAWRKAVKEWKASNASA